MTDLSGRNRETVAALTIVVITLVAITWYSTTMTDTDRYVTVGIAVIIAGVSFLAGHAAIEWYRSKNATD